MSGSESGQNFITVSYYHILSPESDFLVPRMITPNSFPRGLFVSVTDIVTNMVSYPSIFILELFWVAYYPSRLSIPSLFFKVFLDLKNVKSVQTI